MEKQNKPVAFSLIKINTVQFAILEECFSDGKDINLTTAVNFGIGKENRIVASTGVFTFEIEQKPFLKLEVSVEFHIDEDSWISFLSSDNSPQFFLKD